MKSLFIKMTSYNNHVIVEVPTNFSLPERCFLTTHQLLNRNIKLVKNLLDQKDKIVSQIDNLESSSNPFKSVLICEKKRMLKVVKTTLTQTAVEIHKLAKKKNAAIRRKLNLKKVSKNPKKDEKKSYKVKRDIKRAQYKLIFLSGEEQLSKDLIQLENLENQLEKILEEKVVFEEHNSTRRLGYSILSERELTVRYAIQCAQESIDYFLGRTSDYEEDENPSNSSASASSASASPVPPIQTTRSGRVVRSPSLFQDEHFVPGANNRHTKGRKIDQACPHYSR